MNSYVQELQLRKKGYLPTTGYNRRCRQRVMVTYTIMDVALINNAKAVLVEPCRKGYAIAWLSAALMFCHAASSALSG